ncbi:MAG: acyloxyacyl hydrolase [Bacteroidales bacterium]|nr:acyloxyacyl hydrolase [Bacteroidales bacterium]
MNKSSRIILTVLLSLILIKDSKAQNSSPFSTSTSIEYAKLLPHHKMMFPLAERDFLNFKLDFSKQRTGKAYWEQKYNYPETGISFLYSELSSPDKIGSAFALLPFINIFIDPSKKLTQGFYFACGIGYLTEKFDRLENYKNIGIGSHLNASVRLYYNLRFPISQHFLMESGLGFTHFSNAAIAHPNRGLNQMSLALGIRYQNAKPQFNAIVLDTAFLRSWEPQIYFNAGYKRLFVGDETAYGAYTMGTAVLWKYSFLKSALFGLDVFYDDSDQAFYKANGTVLPAHQFIKTGLYVGHQWAMNRFSFGIQFGGYLYAPNKVGDVGNFYNRLVLRYRVSQSLSLNSSIKAHFAKADFMEWGLVYQPKIILR